MTFEENSHIIIKEIEKRRGKWRLDSVKFLDFDDIKQEILIHIWEKWDKYDPSKPLLNWINKIITNQMINKIRDNYGTFIRPCVACDKNEGGDHCSFTKSGLQCSECPLYAEWEAKKKSAYEIHLAKELEYHPTEYSYSQEDEIDYHAFLLKNAPRIEQMINPTAYKIYVYMFIEGHDEEETARYMKFKTSGDSRRGSGHKQIANYKKQIREILKEVLENEEYRFTDYEQP